MSCMFRSFYIPRWRNTELIYKTSLSRLITARHEGFSHTEALSLKQARVIRNGTQKGTDLKI